MPGWRTLRNLDIYIFIGFWFIVPYKAKIDQRKMTWAYVRLGFEAKIDEKSHGLPPKANEK